MKCRLAVSVYFANTYAVATQTTTRSQLFMQIRTVMNCMPVILYSDIEN